MDPNALALDPHIDSDAMYEELSSVGDMEIADLWAHGVTFKADMPKWVVIHPNLLNFYDNLAAATDELD
eukprot:7386822-Prymnesium_polylepis.1